jgi:hypothetical protein
LTIRAVYPTTCSAYAPSRIFVIQEAEVVAEVEVEAEVVAEVAEVAILQPRRSARAVSGRIMRR